MGAWGYGHFEDDAAFDFMAEVEESDNPKGLLKNTFKTAIDTDYLDADAANAVIVAATYVDRQTHGTKFSAVDDDDPYDVDTFPDRHPEIDLSSLKGDAVQALQIVLGEISELNELWSENDELYPAWRQGIEKLIDRLRE
ncbi:DUF4259 domain-containing protein [Mucilaginibacter segetis]|uniref:DUF4259 domain-containing protein n=1 Tax=Mucilaginibacter segetis TaxID=2793071 RepID=A0A934UNA9_9SPHI|nr:DUF4259 domain-containing protein [Mucilaginibacter segetis]MBK0380603.1 DUF4259 domain-containing protein [Mucilaginibacter segetis]